jgi:hypothetical protein
MRTVSPVRSGKSGNLFAAALTLLVGLACSGQEKQESVSQECTKTIRVYGSLPTAPYTVLFDKFKRQRVPLDESARPDFNVAPKLQKIR